MPVNLPSAARFLLDVLGSVAGSPAKESQYLGAAENSASSNSCVPLVDPHGDDATSRRDTCPYNKKNVVAVRYRNGWPMADRWLADPLIFLTAGTPLRASPKSQHGGHGSESMNRNRTGKGHHPSCWAIHL